MRRIAFVTLCAAAVSMTADPAFARTVRQGTATVRNGSGDLALVGRGDGVLVERLRAGRNGAPVRAGDLIAAVDGAQVGTPEDLFVQLRNKPSGSSVRLSILRDGRTLETTAQTAWFAPFMTPEPPLPPAAPSGS